jgi:site-specific recombinase XerC
MRKQVVDHFKRIECFGQSRYEAKQAAIAEARVAGVTAWSPARTEGVYSFGTKETYIKESIAFAQWAKQVHGCKYLPDARAYVNEYLQMRLQRGHSAWTLQLVRSACAKLFLDPGLAKENKLPTRRKENITRSRGPKAMDAKFSELRNRDLVDFSRAAGLRRRELAALTAGDVYSADGRVMVFVGRGKGGRPRTVPVLSSMQERVLEIVQGRQKDEMVFKRIPGRADVHGYRREYAQALYEQERGKHMIPKIKIKKHCELLAQRSGITDLMLLPEIISVDTIMSAQSAIHPSLL